MGERFKQNVFTKELIKIANKHKAMIKLVIKEIQIKNIK